MSGATTRAALLAGFPIGGPPGGITPINYQNLTLTVLGPSVTLTPSAGAVTWNLSTAPIATVTLTANTTITVTGGEDGFTFYRLAIIQGGAGSFTPTFVGLNFSAAPSWNTAPTSGNRVHVDCVGSTLNADVYPSAAPTVAWPGQVGNAVGFAAYGDGVLGTTAGSSIVSGTSGAHQVYTKLKFTSAGTISAIWVYFVQCDFPSGTGGVLVSGSNVTFTGCRFQSNQTGELQCPDYRRQHLVFIL